MTDQASSEQITRYADMFAAMGTDSRQSQKKSGSGHGPGDFERSVRPCRGNRRATSAQNGPRQQKLHRYKYDAGNPEGPAELAVVENCFG